MHSECLFRENKRINDADDLFLTVLILFYIFIILMQHYVNKYILIIMMHFSLENKIVGYSHHILK